MITTSPPAIAPLRSPHSLEPSPIRESLPIERSKILVVAKRTRIERDMEVLNISYDDALKKYELCGENVTELVASHNEQLGNKERITKLLSPKQVRFREEYSDEELNRAALVIALGGDNHFQAVSHRIHGDTPLLGVSSDKRSYGALLSCRAEEFEGLLLSLEKGDYNIAAWPRLQVEVQGQQLPPALCDLLIAERDRSEMSRHILIVKDAHGETLHNIGERGVSQKSSGLLVATGAGANNRAWSRAASRFVFPEGLSFSKTARKAMFILTEPSNTHPGISEESQELPPLTAGDIVDGEEMVITSLNDSEGIIKADSLEELQFPRGAKAKIRLAHSPAWIVSRKT
jgi:hypothetical protein